jgi:hypothetical protein
MQTVPARAVRDGSGRPGVWVKQAVQGAVVAKLAPSSGALDDLLKPALGAVSGDPRVEQVRALNPGTL